jgi:hypothetical protein
MTTKKVELSTELETTLKQLKENYEAASRIHVPNWKGGPNMGILSELVRMGWRKTS